MPAGKTFRSGHVVLAPFGIAQSVEHRSISLKVLVSSPTVAKNFSFCILSLSTRSWQIDWSHTNEIKHDVHPRYIGA